MARNLITIRGKNGKLYRRWVTITNWIQAEKKGVTIDGKFIVENVSFSNKYYVAKDNRGFQYIMIDSQNTFDDSETIWEKQQTKENL